MRKVCSLLYADDVALLAESQADLRNMFSSVAGWADAYCMKIGYQGCASLALFGANDVPSFTPIYSAQPVPQRGCSTSTVPVSNGTRRKRSRITVSGTVQYKPSFGKNRHPRFLLQIRRNHNRRVTGSMFPAVSAQSHATHVIDGNSRDVTHVRTSHQDRRPQTRQCRSPPRLDTTPP